MNIYRPSWYKYDSRLNANGYLYSGGFLFGYTIINDVSARDIQLKHQQRYFGKSLDGYTPMGPCIVTADEIDNVHDLDITCYVNGEKRQSSNTGYM